MLANRNLLISVCISCLILFAANLAFSDLKDFEKVIRNPLDNSYSVLGQKSVFGEYIRSKKVYAFLPYWVLGDKDINLEHVTDLAYFGLYVDSRGRIITNDGPYKKWRESSAIPKIFSKLRKSGGTPSLTLICHEDKTLDALLVCEDCWQELANDVQKELEWAGIKNINVDFEYSGYTTKEKADNYTKMVGVLNSSLDKAFGNAFVVVSTFADSADRSDREETRIADPKGLVEVADALFIMAYDFHQPTSNNAGPVSPLDGSYTTTRLNLIKTVDTYLTMVSADKLILGLPFYGYDWLVEDEAPMSKRIEGNDALGYSGVKTYAEITDLMVKKQLKPQFYDLSKSYYVNYIDSDTGSKRQIWYDNAESLGYKVDLAYKKNFLGVGVWAAGFEEGYTDLWKVFKSRI